MKSITCVDMFSFLFSFCLWNLQTGEILLRFLGFFGVWCILRVVQFWIALTLKMWGDWCKRRGRCHLSEWPRFTEPHSRVFFRSLKCVEGRNLWCVLWRSWNLRTQVFRGLTQRRLPVLDESLQSAPEWLFRKMTVLAERAKLWYQLKLSSESVDFIIWRWFSSFSLQKYFCRDRLFDQSVLTFYIIMHTYALAIRFVLGKLFTYINRKNPKINEFGKMVVLSGSYLYCKCW